MNHFQKRSLEGLFKAYSRGMYNICLRMIGNQADAEDVLQDAFIQAYMKINQLQSKDRFGAWLKRIVINQCLQFLRSRILFVDINDEYDLEPEEERSISTFSMNRINYEIQQLPDGCRIVFNLFLLENYSHKEVADMLNISESTSKSQYQRARKLLQQRLKDVKTNG